jgi:pteridine reductase
MPPKAALITGSAIRIGQAIARSLAQTGHDIALHYNSSKDQAKKLAHQLNQLPITCKLFQADLADQNQLQNLISQTKNAFPHLDLLINSASIFEKANLTQTQTDLFDRHFAINLKAPIILSRDFARSVNKGHIINILDQRIAHNRPDYFAYTLTKKSLADFTRMAAVELGPNIRVNAIAPGFILPPTDPAAFDTQRILENIPLKKQGSTDTITRSVKFLLENDYLTGQILFADGGEHL